jgi:hypothetical protein
MKAFLILSCEGRQDDGFHFCNGVENIILDLEKVEASKDYVNLIKGDEFLSQRFITFNHQGKKYDYAHQVIEDYPHYQIKFDFETLGENTPNDFHPSDKMHKVIAENIINFLEKDVL